MRFPRKKLLDLQLANRFAFAPDLYLDFRSGVIDPRLTYTGGANGSYFNASGALVTGNAANSPRFTYDTTTGQCLGLMREKQRTNSLRNNTMVGAVAGTPGTLPTNWVATAAGGNITSRAVVSAGTENGIPYVDVRYVFSGAATANVRHEAVGQIAATSTQTWTASAFVKLVGGSTSNVTTNVVVTQYDAGSVALEATSVAFTPQSTALGTSRPTNTKATTQATISSVTSTVSIVASGAADITLRIGMPQLELGPCVSSVIATSGSAVTRTADRISDTNPVWYRQDQGTFVVEGRTALVSSSASRRLVSMSDNSANNYVGLELNTSGAATAVTASGGSADGTAATSGTVTVNTTFRAAMSYGTNDLRASRDAGAVASDTSVTVPTGLTRADFGSDHAGTTDLESATIARVLYWRQAANNDTLMRKGMA